MKVGLFQYDISWEDKASSKKRILSILDSNKRSKMDWIIFPEMTLTGFSMDTKKTELDVEDIKFFNSIAKDQSAYVSFGGVMDDRNVVLTVSPDGTLINKYSKVHLFGYGDETSHYKPGDRTEVFEIMGLRVLPSICYDLRFSYQFWDHAVAVDVFFVIASWPKTRSEHWKTLLKARAIENQSYFIGVNRIGVGAKLEYSGDSAVHGPFGEELLNCRDKEGLFVVDISKGEVAKVRREYPFLSDRKK